MQSKSVGYNDMHTESVGRDEHLSLHQVSITWSTRSHDIVEQFAEWDKEDNQIYTVYYCLCS